MDYVIISGRALVIALLTLFCGFGLSTLLMPIFAVFFGVEVAVAATAVVHLANNLFKLLLVGRHADRSAVLKFGLPAVVAALAGAALLGLVAQVPAITTYTLGDRAHEVTVVKILIGILIIVFSAFDVVPRLRKLSIDRRYLPLGGLLSGFFGGLSGHQGALRSAFLIKLGLTTRGFVATGVVVAVMVDFARLAVYGVHFALGGVGLESDQPRLAGLVAAATIAAFVGSFVGARLLTKVTIDLVRPVGGGLLLVLGLGLATGRG